MLSVVLEAVVGFFIAAVPERHPWRAVVLVLYAALLAAVVVLAISAL